MGKETVLSRAWGNLEGRASNFYHQLVAYWRNGDIYNLRESRNTMTQKKSADLNWLLLRIKQIQNVKFNTGKDDTHENRPRKYV